MSEEFASGEFELISAETGERIDRFLSGKRQDLSRSYIQKLIKGGDPARHSL